MVKTAAIDVLRAFWLDGQVQRVGTSLEVAQAVAVELVAAGKARRSAPPAEPVPAPSRARAAKATEQPT